jgi:hypothetical protein
MLMWYHGGVWIVIHPDMGIMKFHSPVPCESCLISKQDVSNKLCTYNAFLLAKHHPCMMVSRSEGLHSQGVTVHGEFSSQAEHWYLQQLQFFAHWFCELPPLFSVSKLPYQEFELIEALYNLIPMEQMTQIHWVTGKVWWLICGMGFCVVAYVLNRGKMLPKNFHWHRHMWNECLPFPKQSNTIHYKTTKQISNPRSITTPSIADFPLVVGK